jgi:tripeptidyl-peptidase-1
MFHSNCYKYCYIITGNLDLQYIMGMAQGVPTEYNHNEPSGNVFVSWILAVATATDPAAVYSVSWGSDETLLSTAIMKSFNDEAVIAGSRGVTIVVASGDDGATQLASDVCQCGSYIPSFPATSPWVTTGVYL